LEIDRQYIIDFATLIRDGNNSVEYFMQKECAKYLTNHTKELIGHLRRVIEEL
jgi:hypothetical protein